MARRVQNLQRFGGSDPFTFETFQMWSLIHEIGTSLCSEGEYLCGNSVPE